jgi:hypothetical protein
MSTHSEQSPRSILPWHSYDCAACAALNSALTDNVMRLLAANAGRRSHFFAGRHENIYLPPEDIPQLELILLTARQQAAAILQQPLESLRIGFWFNLMRQGDVTTSHTHDDDTELLSGTYYIKVPPDSGELVLQITGQSHPIAPHAGRFIFFAPTIVHAVTRHNAPQPRLSLGFNVGPISTG